MTIQKNTRTEIKRQFGHTVRMLRHASQLTQEQLAERAQLHPTYISSIELGERSVGLEKIISIARALGVSPRVLLPES